MFVSFGSILAIGRVDDGGVSCLGWITRAISIVTAQVFDVWLCTQAMKEKLF